MVLCQSNWKAESRAYSPELDARVALDVVVDLRTRTVAKRRLVISADVNAEGGGQSQQAIRVGCDCPKALLLL